MYLCYIDESGTADVPGNTSHFVLAGVSIPIWHWRNSDREITAALKARGLEGEELHTAWLLRPYLEQRRIANFEQLGWAARRSAVEKERRKHLLALQKAQRRGAFQQTKKNYRKTQPYIHLTYDERVALVIDVADRVSGWGSARLFAECIDKIYFDSEKAKKSIDEQAFEQVVSRFEQYLANVAGQGEKNFGLLVHDNNPTLAKKHTELMRTFHKQGTLWTNVDHIIETPFFVDSSLTRMVQVADLCSYALRRYVENNETDLFRRVFQRADRAGQATVGVRHFSEQSCKCEICVSH